MKLLNGRVFWMQVVREGGQATAEKALKLISRLVASSGGSSSGLAGVSDSPSGVVARVRRMRAERDQLRMRDASSCLQLASVRPFPPSTGPFST